MKKRLLEWLRRKLGITALEQEHRDLAAEWHSQYASLRRLLREIKSHTRVDADVGLRGNNTIILTGIYRKKVFIRFYDVGEGEFAHLVDILQHMQAHCTIRHIDAPPAFKAVYDLEP